MFDNLHEELCSDEARRISEDASRNVLHAIANQHGGLALFEMNEGEAHVIVSGLAL